MALLLAACRQAPPAPPPTRAEAANAPLLSVAREALPAVVNIYALKAGPQPPLIVLLNSNLTFSRAVGAWLKGKFMPMYKGLGTGSGFLISKRGYILTNYHVIEGADRIIVRVAHRREVEEEAQILGADPLSDVALIRIRADYRHHVLPLGDSDALEVGEMVAAVGNPYDVGKTFTVGVVSALKREDLGIADLEDFIQTDAAINPGNSGGPLINLKGEAVGINTAIYGEASGIGFAVPINIARGIMAPLAGGERIRRGMLGVTLEDITEAMAPRLGVAPGEGVLVVGVYKASPAAAAGLRPGDVITRFNGGKITHYAQLKKAVVSLAAGVRVTIEAIREGKSLTVEATLAELKVK